MTWKLGFSRLQHDGNLLGVGKRYSRMTSKQSVQFFHTLLIINASNMQYIYCSWLCVVKFSCLFTAVAVLACLRSLLYWLCCAVLYCAVPVYPKPFQNNEKRSINQCKSLYCTFVNFDQHFIQAVTKNCVKVIFIPLVQLLQHKILDVISKTTQREIFKRWQY